MKLQPACNMTNTKTLSDNKHTLYHSSKNQLLEQLQSELQEVKSITQPLLDTEAGFIKDLDHNLSHRDAMEMRKRKLLHKRWTRNVCLPLQQSIQQHFTEHGYNEKKIKSMFSHYIDYCNAKGFVFLDTYDPLEYNPFLHNFISTPHYHKIFTPPLEDPLCFQSRARIKEKTAILRCQTGHMYRCQEVEDLLRSSSVSQQSCKQSKASLRPREDRRSRSRATPHMASTERWGFHTHCCASR